MTMFRVLKDSSALSALALASALLLPAAVQADEVTLKSADGTVNLVGDFVDFSDNTYVIRTGLGELRISASRVRCEGDACPAFETADADVQFAGSDTVGLGVMPLLLEGYAGYLNAEATVTSTATDNQIIAELIGDEGFGDELGSYLVTSTGSSDAFRALLSDNAEIGMASRRIRPAEARQLRDAGAGNMIDPRQEHILAVDSLVVITHPDNPIDSLTTIELAAIYSGQISNWSEVGGEDAPILVATRQDGSGTLAVFQDRIFGDSDVATPASAVVAADNTEMASLVNNDPNAIGFVGYAFQRGAKPLTLVNECGLSMTPDAFSARTEEYALQRRLYLYNRGDAVSEDTQEFLNYALSESADGVIAKAGFIDLGVDRRAQPLDGDRARSLLRTDTDAYEGGVMREMLSVMVDFDRLSTTFRFNTGSSRLDERGLLNMQRLADYLETQPEDTKVMFVGFTDGVGAFDSNRALSVSRASQVMDELTSFAGERLAGLDITASGFGEVAPAACNISEDGRRINRRVEVWIESAG